MSSMYANYKSLINTTCGSGIAEKWFDEID